MQFKNILDMHIHTDNSPDGNHSTTHMCEIATEKGLRAVTFTDHCEVDYYKRDSYDKSSFHAFFEVSKAKSAFTGKLLVCNGIELGQPMYDVKMAESIIEKLDYDEVIGSVHNLRGMLDFWFLDYTQYDTDKLLDEYFDEELLLAKWGKFDTLAHLTYPLRYMVGEHNISVDLSKYMDKIVEVLKLLVEKGKALEINTSGLRQKIGKTMPGAEIVKLFKELGGEFITIGSDAHFAKDIGAGVQEGLQIAVDAGFTHVALYQKRQPVLIKIE